MQTSEDMKGGRPRSRDKGKKKAGRTGKGGIVGKETKRLVPKSHANRPYFDVPNTARGNGTPMYHSEPLNYSRAGIGVVFRDADSSARALQDLSQKKQERAERKRAIMLLAILIAMASSVHVFTKPKVMPTMKGPLQGSDERTDYDEKGAEKGVDGESDIGISEGSSNSTRADTIWNHLADAKNDVVDSTPFFFHVPRNGGQTVKDIVGVCLDKIQANEVGIRDGHHTDTQIRMIEIDNSRYINVDTSSKEGIERAAMMGFEQAQMAEMVTSSYFLNAAKYLFSAERQGRAYVMLRNPIDRAVSMYYHQKSNGVLDDKLTLEDYARGEGIENNWITRFLTNAMEGELKKSNLEHAKKILGKKFLIGFLDDAEESIYRLKKYNGWDISSDEVDETKEYEQKMCIQKRIEEGNNKNINPYEMPKKGSQAYALLSWQTQYDMKLYDFAKQLFEFQTTKYGSKERKKEMKKKNKVKEKR